MGILSGVVSYIFGLVLNVLDAAIDGFLGALGFDLDSFEYYFPAAAEYHEVLIGFAIGLLLIMFIFQIFRNFGIVLDMEAEDPLKMLGKTALFLGMIVFSRSITNLVIQLLVDPYAIFIGAPSSPYEFKLRTIVTGMFNSAFANPFMAVVALIMMLVLGWEFLKFCVEVVERYIVFYFVIYIAPVVFATGPFQSTSQIFKSWCRMLASQAMLLLLNIWSIQLFLSYLPVFEQGGHDIGSIFFNFLMGYAFLKFAQKADTLLRILGLPTASTGDIMHSLGGTVAGIAHAIGGIGGGIGKGVSTLGGLFGKGAQAATSVAGSAASAAAGAGGSAVSGMAGASGAAASAVGGAAANAIGGQRLSGDVGNGAQGADAGQDSGSLASGNSQGVTDSGIDAAKQNYTDDVLGSAQDQLSAQEIGESMGDSSGESVSQDTAIRMDSGEASIGNPQDITDETVEGLANLAHGIPHDSYDADTNSFSGGGFQEFTGRDANMIGSSQLTPADGVEQYHVDMGNGEVGTVYKDSETGEAHVVQFDSVDNGVMQGSISQIDPQTGQLGEPTPFTAVHESVPGSSELGGDGVSVADSQGGSYHVATDAPTSFFASGEQAMGEGASTAPAASTGSAEISVSGPSSSGGSLDPGGGATRGFGTGREQVQNHSGDTDNLGGDVGSAYVPGGGFVSGSGSTRGGGAGRRPSSSGSTAPSTDSALNDSGIGSAPAPENLSADTGTSDPLSGTSNGAPAAQNDVYRFSRTNPANLEVFQRGNNVEAYDKYNPDTVPLDLDD